MVCLVQTQLCMKAVVKDGIEELRPLQGEVLAMYVMSGCGQLHT